MNPELNIIKLLSTHTIEGLIRDLKTRIREEERVVRIYEEFVNKRREDELEYERYKAAQEQERAELEVALWREREAEKVQREVKP